MAIRVRQELGYAPAPPAAHHEKSPTRDLLEFVNEDGEVIFSIETTKEWVTETIEGYLGEDPDIEGHTFQFEKTTVTYGMPEATGQPRFREI
jgi:hypothetical protein